MKDSSSSNPIWETAVIGAGAAGLMTAIWLARHGISVLLVDGKEKIGAKILMSGGTRCNITNKEILPSDYHSEKINVVKRILNYFSSEKAIEFFKELGIDVVLEAGGKYFPTTHSGRTVLEALMREMEHSGVHLETNKRVTAIEWVAAKNHFVISGAEFSFIARKVVLATGGLSFPATGSDGVGYQIAQHFKHELIATSPSLTPLTTNDADWQSLTGITLPAKLTLYSANKNIAQYEGSFLFTHFGYSGPVVLNMSRHWIREKDKKSLRLMANFLPQEKEDLLRQEFIQKAEKRQQDSVKRYLTTKIPERLADVFFKRSGIPSDMIFNFFKKEQRENLLKNLFQQELPVTGDMGYAKAEVTAGGISFDEVETQTLQSKKQSGLYFVGEILDVDGRIGGFNFQWAWSSAVFVADMIARQLRR